MTGGQNIYIILTRETYNPVFVVVQSNRVKTEEFNNFFEDYNDHPIFILLHLNHKFILYSLFTFYYN